jgi:replication-associated recombination protein RarA
MQLTRDFRPKTFRELVGQDKLIHRVRGLLKKRNQTAWLFTGESGSGKTTVARIMALSFQCRHQDKFGNPCKKCYRRKRSFDIVESNASEDTGKEEMQNIIADSNLYPKHGSRYRVYILDEFQGLSKHAQKMLLKKTEESPKTCIWILCTSEPELVVKAMWRRVKSIGLEKLNEEGIRKLIRRVLKFAKELEEDCSPLKLCEALIENGVTSAGFVVKAIENKLAGATYEEAAVVEYTSTFNPRYLIRAITKGDWSGARKYLGEATKEDARAIRGTISAWLSTVLIDSEEMDDRTEAIAKAIEKITDAAGENSTILARVRAACFYATRIFNSHPR